MGELEFSEDDSMPLNCDNHAAIYIASNPIFHEKTKHIHVYCHFVCDVMARKLISTPFTPTSEEIVDMFTEPVTTRILSYLCNKTGMIDIYAPT